MRIKELLYIAPSRSALYYEDLICFVERKNLVESQHVESNCIRVKRLAPHTVPFARNGYLDSTRTRSQDRTTNFVFGLGLNHFANYCPVEQRHVVHDIRMFNWRCGGIEGSEKSDDNP